MRRQRSAEPDDMHAMTVRLPWPLYERLLKHKLAHSLAGQYVGMNEIVRSALVSFLDRSEALEKKNDARS